MVPTGVRSTWRWALVRGGVLLPLGVVVGAAAGLGAAGFAVLVRTFSSVLTGRADFDPSPDPFLAGPAWWFVPLAPAVAGLVYGPLVAVFAPGPGGQGIGDVMAAVRARAGRMSLRRTGIGVIAATVFIAGGGSVGRVGPIVQLGAAFGSATARLARISRAWSPMLVSAGAAGGFAAVLDAPVAAPFFVAELIVGRFRPATFAFAGVAGVVGDLVAGSLGGHLTLLNSSSTSVAPLSWPGIVALGLAVGAVGVAFNRSFHALQRLCARGHHVPPWLRPAVGGLLLGGLLLVLPPLYGTGTAAIRHTLDGAYPVGVLLLLAAGKIVATSLSLGIGGRGGLFGPIMFVGATSGAAFGALVGGPNAWLYGVLGIAAALAATAHAPVTAVVLLAELTAMPELLPALIITVVAASLTARALARQSIFTQVR